MAPPALPRIVWETGASTYNLTETQQAQWATLMLEAVTSLGVHGFNWWQFIDWAPTPFCGVGLGAVRGALRRARGDTWTYMEGVYSTY